MSPIFYYVLHVAGLLLLSGSAFAAFADPSPARRRPGSIAAAILGLLVLTGGFGLLARLGYGWPGWMLVKTACLLGVVLSIFLVLRRPQLASALRPVTVLLLVVAVLMVYLKPF
ncbi:MAG: hypothetical protein ISR76_06310 [Planctomycetes bacterium]|nr:hypothetical protein [Planctomycetota bacterium]MBL7008593.1 hypothetical protein [Planctomycetota bacterium]